MKKKKSLTKKTKKNPQKDLRNLLNEVKVSSTFVGLSDLSGETFGFSTIEHKELLKDYEKLRFDKRKKK